MSKKSRNKTASPHQSSVGGREDIHEGVAKSVDRSEDFKAVGMIYNIISYLKCRGSIKHLIDARCILC